MLIYFGFTYCSDVCPTDLQAIARRWIDSDRRARQCSRCSSPSIPRRTRRNSSRNTVRLFHPRFVGLTGDAIRIGAAARAYRVYYKKVEWDDRSGYTIDHSAFIYLINRDGEYLGFFPPGTSAERLVEGIRPHLGASP